MTNWPEYNKKLLNEVVDVFVSTELLLDQEKQLKQMNKDKRGRPYSYSDALTFIILAVREYFALPYRRRDLPRCSVEYEKQGYRRIHKYVESRRNSMRPLGEI